MVGDTDHSQTAEYEFEIGDDTFVNLTTGKTIGGSMKDVYSQLCAETRQLSCGVYGVPVMVMQNVYENFLEEAGHVDSYILNQEWGVSQFENKRKKYNGKFYFRYIVEDDAVIENEIVFLFRGNEL